MAGTFNSGGLSAPPKSIVNFWSAGGAQGLSMAATGINAAKETLSGALTAATYKELLSISGPGILLFAVAKTKDATSRTVGLKVIIDGVTIFDAITAAITTVDYGLMAVGCISTSTYGSDEFMAFNSSLSLSVKSSLGETDKVSVIYKYVTT